MNVDDESNDIDTHEIKTYSKDHIGNTKKHVDQKVKEETYDGASLTEDTIKKKARLLLKG